MNGAIQCGGLMERNDLCLVEVLGFSLDPGQACGILGKFGQAGIPLSYLSVGNGADGTKNMSFCVHTAELASRRHILQEVRAEFMLKKLEVHAPVTILTLYGPHFLDKPNLATLVFSVLCAEGIDAQTVCSSVNSISVVVDALERDRTIECLRREFNWPQ